MTDFRHKRYLSVNIKHYSAEACYPTMDDFYWTCFKYRFAEVQGIVISSGKNKSLLTSLQEERRQQIFFRQGSVDSVSMGVFG